ncbi:YggS family pyridoxal phosphate-dependent enzyme [Rhodoligotrophos defluvii]|uniref:YggS family pyridoxal phosphate-dependent enzyme n=1 Tax=Rhodoligotrophos defluvii TaxID=2561934 RepID=UPI0010C9BDF5|nr:YggS family pyridoxal phosphate-dependent enzyme [Rhodoligotrophos defluvii]
MDSALKAAGRPVGDATLIAVSKTFGPEEIVPVIEAGQRVFGENRVQEAKAKYPSLRKRYPDLELHLIGPLQTNKVKEAVALFDAIHTVDRPKLAAELAKEMQKQNRHPRLFIQVNTGAEPQKAGVLPDEADAFIAQCREQFGLETAGLMCIPPVDEEPSLHFALLDKIAKRNGIKNLSMGMSGDFETAIAFGANYIRVGSAIFGARAYPATDHA